MTCRWYIVEHEQIFNDMKFHWRKQDKQSQQIIPIFFSIKIFHRCGVEVKLWRAIMKHRKQFPAPSEWMCNGMELRHTRLSRRWIYAAVRAKMQFNIQLLIDFCLFFFHNFILLSLALPYCNRWKCFIIVRLIIVIFFNVYLVIQIKITFVDLAFFLYSLKLNC